MVTLQAYHVNARWITTYHVTAIPQKNEWILIVNFVNQESLRLTYYDDKVFKDMKKIDECLEKQGL